MMINKTTTMTFLNLMSALFNINSRPDIETPKEVTMPVQNSVSPVKYKGDIDALEEKYGPNFKSGFCIEIELKDMLYVCPRSRRRIESYNGLRSKLREEYGVELKIYSRKTKKNE